ncbi:MAG: YbaK/EbsC family protein [Clostridia bacterium]|nr:YbaK/EbsC family protein [Clostridia bacterium]
MAIERVRAYLAAYGLENEIQELAVSSATVALAAEALGVEGARIAKTLSFKKGEGCLLVVAAGDAKIDNHNFKTEFGVKASMPAGDEVERLVGHAIGGVCPFGVNEGVQVYLDVSLKRFETVFPACGSSNSAIEMTPDKLFECAQAKKWVDVCKAWREEN